MIESPLGVLQAFAIAVHPMVSCLVMGTADLAKEMRVQIRGAKRANLHFALQSVILAARAAQVTVLDGVYGQFKDEEGFLTQCQEGAELGFDGKTLIHPSQVAVANRLFLPAEEEVVFARRVVAAWQHAYERGEEICVVDGRMIERLHAQDALRLISLWEKANAT
ncbi:MAG: hypothetical protein G8345_01670 [Magnetococcales bacterium]|nr:hypothetical protein [Magnetococcales bacterium]